METKTLGIPIEFYYPAFTALILLLTILFVPKSRFKSLFWLSMIWGFLGSMIIGTILGQILKLFEWQHTMPFNFYGHPTWINVAWLLSIMLYLHFLPTQKEWYYFASYLFGFATASAVIDKIFNQIGMLQYSHWNPLYRFFIALIWFYGAAYHYDYMRKKEKLDG